MMMIKSFLLLLSTYLLSLSVIVGSVPLRVQRMSRMNSLGRRYRQKQRATRRFFYSNFFYRLRSSSKGHLGTRLTCYSQRNSVPSYWELTGVKKGSCSYRKRADDQKKNRGFYGFPCLFAAATILIAEKEEDHKKSGLIFIKRKKLLAEMQEGLRKGSLLITGSAGSGKTWLLRKLTELLQDECPFIFCINATSDEAYDRNLRVLATALGLDNVEHKSIKHVEEFVNNFKQGLTVYDKFFLSSSLGQAKLFESCDVTNRCMITILKGDSSIKVAEKVSVPSLNLEEIKVFLHQQQLPDFSDDLLNELASLLLGQPTSTIILVVSYLRQYKPQYRKFVNVLRQKGHITENINQDHLDKLEKNDKRLLQVLGILCYLNPHDISDELLSDLLDKNDIQKMLDLGLLSDNTLCSYVTRYSGRYDLNGKSVKLGVQRIEMPKFYAISSTLQDSIRYHAATIEVLDSAIAFFRDSFSYQYEDLQTWKKVKMQYRHICKLWEFVKDFKNASFILAMVPIMTRLANYCLEVKYDLKEAEKILKDVLLTLTPDRFGKLPDSVMADIYWSLGRLKLEQDDLDISVDHFKKALTYNLKEDTQADIYCSLAEVYFKKRKSTLCSESIGRATESSTMSKFTCAKISWIKALEYCRNGQLDHALQSIRNALMLVGNKKHPCKLPMYDTMFSINSMLDQEKLCKENLLSIEEITTQYFPYYHKWTMNYCHKKAILEMRNGTNALSDAVSEYEKALEIGKKIWKRDHSYNIRCMINLAMAYAKRGSDNNALEYLHKALQHIETQSSDVQAIVYLAFENFYRGLKCYAASSWYTELSLKAMKSCSGYYLRMAEAKLCSGLNNKAMGNTELAEKMFNETLPIYRKYFREDHKRINDIVSIFLNECLNFNLFPVFLNEPF